MIRSVSRTALTLDIVGAVLLFVLLAPVSMVFYGIGPLSQTVPEYIAIIAMYASAALQCAGVAVGRLAPGYALALAWVGAFVQMAAGLQPVPVNIAILIVVFATAAWGSDRVFWVGLASTVGGGIIAAVYISFLNGAPDKGLIGRVSTAVGLAVVCILTIGAAWLGGFGWRMMLRWRASREAQSRAELATAEEQERVRIARDMHDVVAHSLAVIVAQSDGARYAAAADPQVATEALSTISQTARAALSDVRMLLTQLRHRQGDGPQPTLADLEQLFAHVRQAGLEPRVTIDPVPIGDPPGAIQLAVYRILQEALTNAIRHGAGGVVDLRMSWHPTQVEIEVRNAVDPAAHTIGAASGGHGVIGMRERAQLVGGSLWAERVDAEFVVRARLPIDASSQAEPQAEPKDAPQAEPKDAPQAAPQTEGNA